MAKLLGRARERHAFAARAVLVNRHIIILLKWLYMRLTPSAVLYGLVSALDGTSRLQHTTPTHP